MTNPKTNMTEEDRLRRDEALMKSLKIFHKTESTPDNWPLHHTNTLQSIDTLGHFRYLSYNAEAPAPHSTSAWRREIKSRAKQISDIAERLYNENPSELTWRLELETLVDARFCLRTEWYVSSNQTWEFVYSITTVKPAAIETAAADFGGQRLKS
jgi:hypothetical protein